jgi:hypothetical protein
MKARIGSYLDSVFRGVEETKELCDFKEELAANLSDKIADLQAGGLSEDEAFRQATASLGDIRSLFGPGNQTEDAAGATTDRDVTARQVRSRHCKWVGYSLLLLALAAYIYLGATGTAGGFRVWWILLIAAQGLATLFQKEFTSGLTWLALAYLIYSGLAGQRLLPGALLLLFAPILGQSLEKHYAGSDD